MSFFDIFKRSGPKESYPHVTDYSSFATDMHSHLIPGIDDGVKTMEESLDLIRSFSELGFKKLITTPHVMSDAFHNTPETILGGLEAVRAAVAAANIPVTIDAAAEYYYDERLPRMIKEEKLLTI